MMSMTWWNCWRISPRALMRFDQAIISPLARAAEVGGDLLGPLERRVHGVRPADGIVIEGHRPTEIVHAAEHLVEVLGNGVEEGHLVEQSYWAPLGGGAVIALDVYDERVVELAHRLNSVHDAAHLVIGMGQRGSIDLHHAGEDLLLIGVEGIPGLDRVGTLRRASSPQG